MPKFNQENAERFIIACRTSHTYREVREKMKPTIMSTNQVAHWRHKLKKLGIILPPFIAPQGYKIFDIEKLKLFASKKLINEKK